MSEKNESSTTITITRIFDAPRSLLWQVWTQAEHIAEWFGPEGFSTRVDKLDFRVGGQALYVMIGPDGTEYPSKGSFLEIVKEEKIVSTDEFGDDFDRSAFPDLPEGMITTTFFEDVDEGQKTRLTVRISHPTIDDKKKHEDMGVIPGWNSSLDCLESYLTKL